MHGFMKWSSVIFAVGRTSHVDIVATVYICTNIRGVHQREIFQEALEANLTIHINLEWPLPQIDFIIFGGNSIG